MIIDRLIRFYHHREQLPNTSIEGIWGGILQTTQKELFDALEAKNSQYLEEILNRKTTVYGVDGFNLEKWTEPYGLEALNALARRLGYINYYNPEQPSPNSNFLSRNGTWLQGIIEQETGSFDLPECFGRKADPGNGATITVLWTLGQCFTIKLSFPKFPAKALEIGAGIGFFGYFGKRFGLKSYTVVDIPTTAVLCAHSLAIMLGEDSVWLYGEPESKTAFAKIYPADAKDLITGKHDLVFNSNSFPEIPINIQNQYVQLIPKWLKDGGILYSCNHESNLVEQRSVKDAIQGDPRYQRIYRAPFMVRAGYMEEMYKVTI